MEKTYQYKFGMRELTAELAPYRWTCTVSDESGKEVMPETYVKRPTLDRIEFCSKLHTENLLAGNPRHGNPVLRFQLRKYDDVGVLIRDEERFARVIVYQTCMSHDPEWQDSIIIEIEDWYSGSKHREGALL